MVALDNGHQRRSIVIIRENVCMEWVADPCACNTRLGMMARNKGEKNREYYYGSCVTRNKVHKQYTASGKLRASV